MSYSLHTALQAFGADLFDHVALSSTSNVCFSPIGIAAMFAILVEGARGNTRKQLMEVLHLPTNFQSEFKEHSKGIKDSKATTIMSSCLLGIDKKIKLEDGYLFNTKQIFNNAKLESLDFGSLDTVNKINDYIKNGAGGLIPKALSTLDVNSLLILVSASVFSGKWHRAFEKRYTTSQSFYLLDNKSNVRIPMMTQTLQRYQFTRQPTFSAVSVPFEGRDISMIFILPNDNTTAELNRMSAPAFLTDFFANRVSWMNTQFVDVTIPKFNFESEYDLTESLPSVGVTDAFSPGADFSKLTKSKCDVHITTAVHKTIISIDENGCTLAALTKAAPVLVVCYDQKPAQVETFRADHPFVFVLFHHVTQQVLLIGRVVDPTNSAKSDKKRTADSLEESSDTRTKKQRISL